MRTRFAAPASTCGQHLYDSCRFISNQIPQGIGSWALTGKSSLLNGCLESIPQALNGLHFVEVAQSKSKRPTRIIQ